MEPIDEQKDIENKRLQPSVRSGIGYTLLLSSMDTHFDSRPLSTLFFFILSLIQKRLPISFVNLTVLRPCNLIKMITPYQSFRCE